MFREIFGKRANERAVEHMSAREITDTKERLKSELRASLYFYDESKFIICAIAGHTEHGEPIVYDSDISDDELGKSICDKLLEFNPKNLAPHTEDKLSDWKAYVRSGAKSSKSFEKKCYYVYMRTVKSALEIEARPRITNERNLSALCSINNGSMHIEIGAAVRKAINAAKLLRDAGAL